MTRIKKQKNKKEVVTEYYKIDVEDWKISYSFQVNKTNRNIIEGDYWENSELILLGKIISPIVKEVERAYICLRARPELYEHWKRETIDNPPQSIGWMCILRDNSFLEMNCYLPSRSFHHLPVAVACGKIKHAFISGTKLKWRQGKIFGIRLSTCPEDE